jgi:uncharacterized 2Fe-2S/4Fe-4S cluster protein (DUF4445 family)
MKMSFKIKIEPQGKILTSHGKEKLKKTLEDNGYFFPMNCGGTGTCSNCRVEFISEPPPMKRIEQQMFGKDSTYRMSCMHSVEQDCTISLPITTEMVNMKTISEMRSGGGASGYGFAIDLGTTTVALYLVDLKSGKIITQQSFINPQNALGGDVMSRLKTASEENGLQELHEQIITKMTEDIQNILKLNKLEINDVKEVSIAGNSVMTHLFLGKNAAGLEHIPFLSDLQEQGWLSFDPAKLGLNIDCTCRLFPVLYGFIGGDTGAAIISCDLDHKKGITLLVDLGTNGEIVLSIDGELYVTSAAAGPAFDGMGMYSGMPALKGAIEGISNDGKLHIINSNESKGICGSGYISLISYMLSNNIIDYSGLIQANHDQSFWLPDKSTNTVRITQDDIRKYQLAKGAIAAGIQILCEESEIDFSEINEVILTGSFGNRVDAAAAIKTGLIPEFQKKIIRFVDNAAGRGAIQSLGATEIHDRMLKVQGNLKVINLGDHPKFQETFVQNMLFPYKD